MYVYDWKKPKKLRVYGPCRKGPESIRQLIPNILNGGAT